METLELHKTFIKCALCRECKGAAYQAPPAFYAGNPNAPFLAIGQNPGEISLKERDRLYWASMLQRYVEADVDLCASTFALWYRWDFGLSYGAKQLALVFGKDWLETGDWLYTNAVRCRTVGNAYPSKEMIENCTSFTKLLTQEREIVIAFSSAAAKQLSALYSVSLPDAIDVGTKPKLMRISHYTQWSKIDISLYEKTISQMTRAYGKRDRN